MKGLLMVRMDALPEIEAEWNLWYDAQHAPSRLNVPGFLSVRRFVAIQGEPKYLNLYDLASPEVMISKPYMKLKDQETFLPAESFETLTPKLPNFSRGIYRQIYPEQDEYQIPNTEAIFVVGHDVPDNRDEEFNAWYNFEHIHAIKRVPGVVAARRFVAIANPIPSREWLKPSGPKYVTVYDIEGKETLQSEAFQRERNSPWTSWVRTWYTHRIFYVGRLIYLNRKKENKASR